MTRAERLTQALKTHDACLYVVRASKGLQVWRKEFPKDWDGLTFSARSEKQFILALTDDWTLNGSPVDWGIEPLLSKIKEMDNWRDPTSYDKMVKTREHNDELKTRRNRNNNRAMALPVRKEIAKASSDYIHQKGND